MENNNKKNIFSKRNIIIGASVLVVLIGLIILIFFWAFSDFKEKNMKCETTVFLGDNFGYLTMGADIVYQNETINNVHYEYRFDLVDSYLERVSLEKLEQKIKEKFDTETTEKMQLSIVSENNSIIIKFFIDYVNFKESDFPTGNLSITSESNNLFEENRNLIKFKEQISNLDGKCE